MTFEYENEESINTNLKCGICMNPLTSPVETPCQHSFCSQCLNRWLNASQSTCPTCRTLITKQNIQQITVRSFLSMLDQLPVICQLCQQSRIERGNYQDHVTKTCSKIHVCCKAKDSGCQWTGLREDLSMHFETCTFKSDENTFRNEELIDVPQSLASQEMNPVQEAIELITNNQRQTVELHDHFISSENLSTIAAALTNNRSIRTLILSRCHIDDQGIKSFVDSLPVETCLRNLNLNGNSITDTGMVSICDLLRTNSSLTHLILTRNQIGNEGVRMLANLFYYHVISLKELCLGSNYLITNQCGSSIYTLIRWHRNLTLLKIEDTRMSRSFLTAIEMFHKLKFSSNLRLIL